jgi:hypothetical protein
MWLAFPLVRKGTHKWVYTKGKTTLLFIETNAGWIWMGFHKNQYRDGNAKSKIEAIRAALRWCVSLS